MSDLPATYKRSIPVDIEHKTLNQQSTLAHELAAN
jgi:hypothetical protein